MRACKLIAVLAATFLLSPFCRADDAGRVKKAVGQVTLDQPGTKPFHLKATLAPSRNADSGSGRTGEVEIWWASPTKWRREVRYPEFHQILVVNGAKEWQKNEGDYFPEWLREIAVALIDPVPLLDHVLEQVQGADVKSFAGNTYFSWMTMSTDGNVKKGMGAGIALTDSTGLILYGGDLGWNALLRNYKNFHGRMVARTVSSGSPEVTAKIVTLEDLRGVPAHFLDASASAGDATLLQTVLVDELSLRKNLLPAEPSTWPAVENGPLKGAITADVVVDRAGKVREVGTILSDNPRLSDTARHSIAAMQFRPYLQNGVPVQVVSRITMPFEAARPAGVETFETAGAYFERGRRVSFPAAGNRPPYILRATFQAAVKAGTVENGTYVDTWASSNEWRREASIGNSRCVRAQHGDTRYELAEGPDVPLLRAVLKMTEPIPALDTFVESDWRIKRDTVDGSKPSAFLRDTKARMGRSIPNTPAATGLTMPAN
jgi:hypothetical protein